MLIRDLADISADMLGGALTIGNFDGVHRGHRCLIERLRYHARRCGGPAVAFTFEPHPATLLRPDKAPPALTWIEQKERWLAEIGVDVVIAFPTDRAFLNCTPGEFFRMVVVEALQSRALVEGPNFLFGRDRSGDVEHLATLCDEQGVVLEIVPPLKDSNLVISSTEIRQCVAVGDVHGASQLLARPHRVMGLVSRGQERGRELGFPTANLTQVRGMLPAAGVYAGRARRADSQESFAAAVNLGGNPTFGETDRKLEVHLIDFQGDLYGNWLEVDFLQRLRDIHTFAHVQALREQLDRDVIAARRICEE